VTCPIIFLLQQETQQNKTIENLIPRISILLLKNWNVFMDIYMSKCLVKESINPYHNPRIIFSSSCDCVFFEKPIRDFYVLRVTRNAFHLIMVCCHDTLLCVTNRHEFCFLLIDFKVWKDETCWFQLANFLRALCNIIYVIKQLRDLELHFWWFR
jgi:hypothetical protein